MPGLPLNLYIAAIMALAVPMTLLSLAPDGGFLAEAVTEDVVLVVGLTVAADAACHLAFSGDGPVG